MDESEQLAAQYLRSLDLGDVVYEPDGNIPPDFLVDGRFAVEVRRLNQNVPSLGGGTEGIEQAAIPLRKRIEKFLPTLGPSVSGESWYVTVDFKRPVGQWKTLADKLQKELSLFKASPRREAKSLHITENLQIELAASSSDQGTFFLYAGGIDCDSGGWKLHELAKNLRLCIAEKERKIASFQSKYEEWWLVLPNHIAPAFTDADQRIIRDELASTINHSWARVVLLDLGDHQRAFET